MVVEPALSPPWADGAGREVIPLSRRRPPLRMKLASVTDDVKRRSGKPAVEKRGASSESRIGWPDVVRALPSDEARTEAMRRYNASGHCPADFAHRSSARSAMAEALIRTEDFLESRGSGTRGERQGIREVRRRLELEIWA